MCEKKYPLPFSILCTFIIVGECRQIYHYLFRCFLKHTQVESQIRSNWNRAIPPAFSHHDKKRTSVSSIKRLSQWLSHIQSGESPDKNKENGDDDHKVNHDKGDHKDGIDNKDGVESGGGSGDVGGGGGSESDIYKVDDEGGDEDKVVNDISLDDDDDNDLNTDNTELMNPPMRTSIRSSLTRKFLRKGAGSDRMKKLPSKKVTLKKKMQKKKEEEEGSNINPQVDIKAEEGEGGGGRGGKAPNSSPFLTERQTSSHSPMMRSGDTITAIASPQIGTII